MYFAKSDYVERYLTSVSAVFKYRDSIPYSKLTPGWQDQNPCRSGRAIIDESLEYAERMKAGSLAPPAIVAKTASGFMILDGRQRCFAAQTNGASAFAAYELINPSPRLERIIAMGANLALNGVRPDRAFAINMAIDFMESDECTVIEAARIAGVTVGTLESNLATRRVIARLAELGVESQLSNGTAAALEVFMSEPDVLKLAHRAVEDTGATIPMVQALVTDMLKQPGKGRLIALDRWIARPEIQNRIHNKRGKKMLAKDSVFQSARALRTILKERFDDIAPEMKEQDKREIAKLGNYINGKIRQLAGEFSTVPA